jgi:hypothetical protein
MATRMAFMFAAILCLATARQAHAQGTGSFSSAYPAVFDTEAIVLNLGEAARLERMRFAASRAVSQTQSSSGAGKYRAVKWGALIGAIAGGAGGALQPTHSNGEYVLGNNRFTSALVIGGIGAGVGALVGLAIEKNRN